MNLPNRNDLFRYLSVAADDADKSGTSLALIVIDIRRFRRINNLYGIQTGEELLTNLVKRVSHVTRQQDRLFLIGNNELALVLPELKNPHIAELAANKVLHVSSNIFHIGTNNLSIDIVLGISLYPRHTQEEDMLLHKAEEALIQAKHSGEPYRTYYEEALPGNITNWDVESELQLALDNNELDFHFQPKVNLQTGQPYGAESLARWHHSEHGNISPELFIAIAEKTGKIQKLTQHCINISFRSAAEWPTTYGLLKLAINLSPAIIDNPETYEHFQSGLKIWGLSPKQLIVEITESGVMEDPTLSSSLFNQLINIGSQISIDDFGTGYSSLTNFKQIPAKELKIDCSFTRNMLVDEEDRIIVKTIIQLAHGFKMSVVAEGIEDLETYLALAEMGCDYGQGYFIGRPMARDTFIEWLNDYQPLNIDEPN